MSIRILLADDHGLFRSGLSSMLNQESDMLVVAEVKDGLEAVRAAQAARPDVIIMDVAMPGMNGIEATRNIIRQVPAAKVLCVSMHSDRHFVLAVLDAGAKGYLLKDCAFDELTRAIRAIANHQIYLSPSVAEVVVEAYRTTGGTKTTSRFSLLTGREREVLQLIAEGFSTRDMAARLFVSQKTINTHRENLMSKLGINNVAGLTKYAIRHGLTLP